VLVELDGVAYRYFPLHLCLVDAGESLVEFERPPKTPRDFQEFDPKDLRSINISLTSKCNFACKYCYAADAHANNEPDMSPEMVSAIISLVSQVNGTVKVSFLPQGESLTTESSLFELCEKLLATGKVHSFSLTTNLSLITNRNIHLIKKYFSRVSASFDGSEYIQNFQRPFLGGQDTFDIVKQALLLLIENRIPFGIRGTITDPMLDYITTIADFLDTLQEHPGYTDMFKEPIRVVLQPYVGSVSDPLTCQDHLRFLGAFERLKQRQMGKLWHVSYGDMEESEYLPIKFVGCGLTNPHTSLTFMNNGLVATCHRKSTPESSALDPLFVGRFDSTQGNYVFNFDKLSKFTSVVGDCVSCVARFSCAGGCFITNQDADAKRFRCNLVRHDLLSHLRKSKIALLQRGSTIPFLGVENGD